MKISREVEGAWSRSLQPLLRGFFAFLFLSLSVRRHGDCLSLAVWLVENSQYPFDFSSRKLEIADKVSLNADLFLCQYIARKSEPVVHWQNQVL